METMRIVNIVACTTIFCWATWCVFSPRVRDGILGKSMLALAAIAAAGVVVGPQGAYDGPRGSEVALNVAIALLGARHITMKYLWPRLVRAIRCATCPNKDQ